MEVHLMNVRNYDTLQKLYMTSSHGPYDPPQVAAVPSISPPSHPGEILQHLGLFLTCLSHCTLTFWRYSKRTKYKITHIPWSFRTHLKVSSVAGNCIWEQNLCTFVSMTLVYGRCPWQKLARTLHKKKKGLILLSFGEQDSIIV